MKGFYDGWDDVLEKCAAVADGLTLPHDFIVADCYWSISGGRRAAIISAISRSVSADA
jgi:hypothetical protein